MRKTLGLDLGTNSLGWAVLDDITGDILNKGVVVFPEGVTEKDDLKTPAAIRREARMGRRMKFRRKMRKWNLLKVLIDEKMCPMTKEELDAWKKNGKYPVDNKAFIDWLKTTIKSTKPNKSTKTRNPYADRAAAASGKVDGLVLGRALYHICQRRGFKSSRKDNAPEDVEETEDTKKKVKSHDEDEQSKVKNGVKSLTRELQESGSKTLGQYFFKLLEEDKDKPEKRRIRGRYTGRIEHYEEEFKVIMAAQDIPLIPRKSKDEEKCLYEKLHDAIFYQRPLRSQKHLVGMCPLEPKSPRCRISHPAYEEFRMLAFVNDLSFEKTDKNGEGTGEKVALTQDERELIYAAFSKKVTSTIEFGEIVNLFKFNPRKDKKNETKRNNRYNTLKLKFHYHRDDEAVPNCPIRNRIAKAFGAVPYDKQDEQKVFDALCYYDNEDLLRAWFKKDNVKVRDKRGRDKYVTNYPMLSEDQIAELVKINPKEGNAKYSLKAIKKMLPFLRQGMQLFDARNLAKLEDLIPNWNEQTKESVCNRFAEIRKEHQRDCEAKRNGLWPKGKPVPTLKELYKKCLINEFGLDERKWDDYERYYQGDSVYKPEEWYWKNRGKKEKVSLVKADGKTPNPRLPEVQLGMIRNPLVQRSMTVLRYLVNYLAEHDENGNKVEMGLGMIDTTDTIRIELAREVNDYATRHAYKNWQDAQSKKRDKARSELAKKTKDGSVSEDDVDRYVLWEEQRHTCFYTGAIIGLNEVLAGSKYNIEHTIPRSRSGDDSLANKTLCDWNYNQNTKNGHIPTECPKWDEIYIRLKPWRDEVARLQKDYDKQKAAAKHTTDPKAKSEARIKALTTKFELDYWRDKVKRFEITADKLEDPKEGLGGFKRRQLVDTGIMCSHAVELLKCLYPRTYAVNGAATKLARKAWGIQPDEAKDRSSHTHHAKDAMVIAALTPKRFNAICAALKDDGTAVRGRECDICPKPYKGFAEKVRKACDEILVKHVVRQLVKYPERQTMLKQGSKRNVQDQSRPIGGKKGVPIGSILLGRDDTMRGQLHNDTVYGCITNPFGQSKVYVVRKPLKGPIAGQTGCIKWIDKIVDPVIRDIVCKSVKDLIKNGVKNIEPGIIKMPSGVPINKVRTYDRTTTPYALRTHTFLSEKDYKKNVYVTSSPNFRLAIFESEGKLSFETESMLTWSQGQRTKDYNSPSSRKGFIGFIVPSCMAIAHSGGGVEEVRNLTNAQIGARLYYVRVFPSRNDNHAEIQFHCEARKKKNITDKASIIDPETPHALIRTSAGRFLNNLLFEGIHFKMMLDGTIKWL